MSDVVVGSCCCCCSFLFFGTIAILIVRDNCEPLNRIAREKQVVCRGRETNFYVTREIMCDYIPHSWHERVVTALVVYASLKCLCALYNVDGFTCS